MSPGRWLRRLIPGRYRPYEILSGLAWRATDGRIAAGPFEGMRYLPAAANSSLVPKLLGTYERELDGVIAAIVASSPRTIVDIGCAEGYYAVGFARCSPPSRVIAFDRDERARTLTGQLAALNDVAARVTVLGACTPGALQKVLEPGSVVFCDVEGFEQTLLDPAAVPALSTAWIVVEVHDDLVPGVGDRLKMRFASSHDIVKREARPRTRADCPPFHPLLTLMPDATVVSLIVERPDIPRMYWLSMKPRA